MRAIITSLFLIICATAQAQLQNEKIVKVPEIQTLVNEVNAKVAQIKSYTCIITKRELVNGRDTGYSYMYAEIELYPLQVYLQFLKPLSIKGREVFYPVNGRMEIRQNKIPRVIHLSVDAPRAMEDNKYPITHIGLDTLVRQLVQRINEELRFKNTIIKSYSNVYMSQGQIAKRAGTLYKLSHSTEQSGMQCKTAEVMIDSELGIPVYFKVVDWQDRIMEQYAFQDLKLILK